MNEVEAALNAGTEREIAAFARVPDGWIKASWLKRIQAMIGDCTDRDQVAILRAAYSRCAKAREK